MDTTFPSSYLTGNASLAGTDQDIYTIEPTKTTPISSNIKERDADMHKKRGDCSRTCLGNLS